jgi:GNAT superfamily N-acetyltransferase
VITDADQVVVAYASIAITAIDRSAAPRELAKAPRELAKQAPDPVPALLLGRLAVDRRYSNLGAGTALVAHVLATAVELNQKAACRAVVVTALTAGAGSWWQRLGFHPFDPADLARAARPIPTDVRNRSDAGEPPETTMNTYSPAASPMVSAEP